MTALVAIDPDDKVVIPLDWSDELPDGVNVVGVDHAVPSPLTREAQATNSPTSSVKVSGAKHGGLYAISALATLSNGEVLGRQVTVRCFRGPNG